MNDKYRCWRLPQLALLLWLVATVGICAASGEPSTSDGSPATEVSAQYDMAMDSAVIREIIAAKPNAQVKKLIVAAYTLSPLNAVEAEQLCRQALALLVNEADQPHRWGVLYILGRILQGQGRVLEAEPLIREAHTIALKYYPPNSTAVFETTTSLAWHTIRTNRTAALTLALQAEQLIEREIPQRQPLDLARDRISVGNLLFDLEESERSEKLLLAVLKDPNYEQLGYYYRARLLSRLGTISAERGDAAQAISYLEQTLTSWAEVEEMTPYNHHERGKSRYLLAQLLLKQQKLAGAEEQFQLAAEEFKISGRTHARASALSLLGNILLIQRRYEEARDVLAEGYKLHKQNRSDGIAFAAAMYGRALAALQNFTGAASALHDAQLAYGKMDGYRSDAANAAYQRGNALWLAGQHCDTRDVFHEALTLLKDVTAEEQIKASQVRALVTEALSQFNFNALCGQPSASTTTQ